MLILRFAGILYVDVAEINSQLDIDNAIIYLLKLTFFIHWFFGTSIDYL